MVLLCHTRQRVVTMHDSLTAHRSIEHLLRKMSVHFGRDAIGNSLRDLQRVIIMCSCQVPRVPNRSVLLRVIYGKSKQTDKVIRERRSLFIRKKRIHGPELLFPERKCRPYIPNAVEREHIRHTRNQEAISCGYYNLVESTQTRRCIHNHKVVFMLLRVLERDRPNLRDCPYRLRLTLKRLTPQFADFILVHVHGQSTRNQVQIPGKAIGRRKLLQISNTILGRLQKEVD